MKNFPNENATVESSASAAALAVADNLTKLSLNSFTLALAEDVSAVVTTSEKSLGVYDVRVVLTYALNASNPVTRNFVVNSQDRTSLITAKAMTDLLNALPAEGSTDTVSTATGQVIQGALTIQALGLPGSPVPGSGFVVVVTKTVSSIGVYSIAIDISHPNYQGGAVQTRAFILTASNKNLLIAQDAVGKITKTTHEFEYGTFKNLTTEQANALVLTT